MSTTYTQTTTSGLTYTIVDNGPVALGAGGESWTVSIKNSQGQSVLAPMNLNTGVLGTGLLGTGGVVVGTSSYNELLSGLSGGTFVTLPGSTGAINLTVALASGNTFYIGGTTTISVAVNALSAQTINVYGGTATFSGSLIAGALSGSAINIGYGGTFNTGTGLLNILNGSTINFSTGGGTLIANGSGPLLDLSLTTVNNYDPSKDVIEFQGQVTQITNYHIENTNGTVTVTLYNGSTEAGIYTAQLASGVTLNTGDYTVGSGSNPLSITYNGANTYVGICYLAGSMIRMPGGDCAVEEVRIGDEVSAFDWRTDTTTTRKVIWAGSKTTTVNPDLPDDEAGYPVRILKDAIADGVPYKDMLITAEHCLFFEGRFVPARMLVNGRSIFYDRSFATYDYYHIETEEHAVIMADGVLTESYLDTGNRGTFRQTGRVLSIGGRRKSWAEDAAAPLGVDRAFAEPLFRRIETRATLSGHESRAPSPALTDDADLHLVTDRGQVIRKARAANGHVSFMIPTGVTSVRLVSRASRPSDTIGPFVDDRRHIGVSVGEITLFEGNHALNVTAHLTDQTLPGWNAREQEDRRWTDGNALLPLGPRYPNGVALLSIQIRAAGPYLAAAGSVDTAEARMA
ncbi:Hint domain-containing protein [Gluconacetobacter takamatsuzukensis]|uniref:Hedgehog/Intein (Hint) domain-containing protein n=1 Tax=Gluconacetobacter takamatsuzukensis TaxID=1286190 RepID=A0A7W4KCQ7_9PROT|nr:Hint domain-containing protein [Gluconacetobacter takamatsuzukensis]MBB2204470.1 hypothetical protein [Gluconacetobacter takamatsuzukensis]